MNKCKPVLILSCILALLVCCSKKNPEPVPEQKFGVFAIEHKLALPGKPEAIYDAMTGDISGWWDHSFCKNPKKFYIEPKPGGGFWEIFDDSGDDVLHATVIFAERGITVKNCQLSIQN